jgi:DnaJ family protein C protein 7
MRSNYESDEDESLVSYNSDDDDDDEELLNHSDHKENGNTAYKQKDYRTAIAHYTLAIETAAASISRNSNDNLEEDEGMAMAMSLEKSTSCDPEILATYYNNRAAAATMILLYEEAVQDCNQAITLFPSFIKAYIRKAKAQTSLGLLSEAMTTLHKASIHDSNNSTIQVLKSEINKLLERINHAKTLLDHPKSSSTSSTSTATSTTAQFPPFPLPNRREALQALQEITIVIASCPSWRSILVEKTKALLALGRFNEAYTTSTSLIRSRDTNNHHFSTLILYRAYCLQHMGNLEDAMKHIKQILSGDPDNAQAFLFFKVLKALAKTKEQGDGFYKRREFDHAVEKYSEALLLNGCMGLYRAKLFFNRACAHANLRNHTKVIEDCSSALQLDNEYVKAILRRAGSYLMMGTEDDCQKAIRDYESVMNLAEKSGDAVQMKEMKGKLREAQVALKRSKQKDFYKMLGCPRDATESEIKKCYRKTALKWHPDRHANSSEEKKVEAEKVFRDCNLAYEVLSDAQKKQKYDSGVDVEDLDNPHAGHGHGHGHGHGGGGGIDPNILFEMFMRQQQGGMGGGGGGFHFG